LIQFKRLAIPTLFHIEPEILIKNNVKDDTPEVYEAAKRLAIDIEKKKIIN
jgi:hypothetical protein